MAQAAVKNAYISAGQTLTNAISIQTAEYLEEICGFYFKKVEDTIEQCFVNFRNDVGGATTSMTATSPSSVSPPRGSKITRGKKRSPKGGKPKKKGESETDFYDPWLSELMTAARAKTNRAGKTAAKKKGKKTFKLPTPPPRPSSPPRQGVPPQQPGSSKGNDVVVETKNAAPNYYHMPVISEETLSQQLRLSDDEGSNAGDGGNGVQVSFENSQMLM